MKTHLSRFGETFSSSSGIYELMEDLGRALSGGGEIIMMGGGNPAHIPEVEILWRRRMNEILAEPGGMEAMLGDYDTPRGRPDFLEIMAQFFNRAFGWKISSRNVAITMGSQTANFLLFNMLAGRGSGIPKKILFPLVPEYIGYASQGIEENMFAAWKPRVELLGNHQFKYHIDFGEIGDEIAAICLSRPTNPSANVITDGEMQRLVSMAAEKSIYLILDNAYGQPFPNVIFTPVQTLWTEGIIHTFSLSKLGLPATRTGIIVANEEIIERVSIMNASLMLSTSSIGQLLTGKLFASGEIEATCRNVIEPFYRKRSSQVREWIGRYFDDALDYHVHVCEGAFFLWLWFRGLPITDLELYSRLKAKNVLVVPGCYFFEGLNESWQHSRECIRITYCAKPEAVQRGIEIIAQEVKRAYSDAIRVN